MPIPTGTKLGTYEVASHIGSGGMGEVYQAHDSKLGRDVAIKVLPEQFARDPERLARFQREAKMLAALNHPNIAAIYGLEQSGDTHYLVMELVPGQTLRERVAGGRPVPVEEALTIARQMAEALEAAHNSEKGIIHRDLKPANVKVTPEGRVKVLDFGLAKAFANDASSEDIGNSPTLSMAATVQGVILGTAAYMSPEQARGKAVTKATDIWAFGAVLYELLTGKQAFHGEDVTDILAAVVRAEPDWSRLPADTPSAIRILLKRCLRKDRQQRLQDAASLRIEIADLLSGAIPQEVSGAQAVSAKKSRLPWVAAAALALISVGALTGWWRAAHPAEQSLRPLVRLNVDLGSDLSFPSVGGATTIISPDGTRLVFISQGRLHTLRLDQPNATELAGTDGASAPFFSPDGQWVAFFAQGKLKKISVEGGAPVTLCDAGSARGASWGDDGNIIAALLPNGGLSRIPAGGGAPTPVTELANGEFTHRWPQVLPGSRQVIFTSHTQTTAFDLASIEIVSLTDKRRQTLQKGGTFGRYIPGGHLLYVSAGTLFALPVDLDGTEPAGTPMPMLEGVGYSLPLGSAQFDFSQTGVLIYQNRRAGQRTVQFLDEASRLQPILQKPGEYFRQRLSPDGRRLALQVTESSGTDIWVYELSRDTMTRLSFGGNGGSPTWTPDGRFIVFQGSGGMFATRADGAGKPQQLTQSTNTQYAGSFSADGKHLAFMETGLGGYDLFTLALEDDGTALRAGKPEPFLRTSFDERHAMLSPDGRWIAYTSNESGSYQVYVRAFPDKGGRWQISNAGGVYPIWSRNGRELFFRTEDNRIMVASYTASSDSFTPDRPRVWSQTTIANIGMLANYDLAPDGKRIVALMPAESTEAQNTLSRVVYLQDFFDEVRRRAAR